MNKTPLIVREAISKSASYLAGSGATAPRLEAELLVGRAVGLDRTQLYVQFDRPLGAEETDVLRALLVARAKDKIPVAYLTGHKSFLGLDLLIPRGVFIPRPETEELVELAATRIARTAFVGDLDLLDLCTGSGAIAVALARKFPQARVLAVDISPEAAGAAEANAERHGLSARIKVSTGDLWTAVPPEALFAAIVSNPPYVSRDRLALLPPEIARHEPATALDGGPDGLDVCRRILAGALPHLIPGGFIAVEHGDEQGEPLANMARAYGFDRVERADDLSGRPRILVAGREMKRVDGDLDWQGWTDGPGDHRSGGNPQRGRGQ